MFPLQARDLSVQFKGKTLIGPIDLDLPKGGITVVLGPNGAGKTSLLKALHGILRTRKGAVSWQIPMQEAAKRQSFVFQTPTMLRRSVMDNLVYPLRLGHMPKDAAAQTARIWAERIELTDRLHLPALRLSGGEKQKLALARALIGKPEMLFLDEPTASLDGKTTRDIERILQECATEGTTLMMSTHNIGQAKRLAEHVFFMYSGKIEAQGPAPAFFTTPPSEKSGKFIDGDIV